MKAMVLEELNTELVLRDVPVPRINGEEVLIKVKACGVCATDLKVISGLVDPGNLPRIIGHEPMGEIVEIGEGVKNFRIGDRVVSSTYITCGRCKYCRQGRETLCTDVRGRIGIDWDGGFAEYMKLPVSNILKVPDNIPDVDASILACGAGVPFHALNGRIKIGPDDTVLIVGVGGVGIQGVQFAKLMGASVIAVDVDDEKLELAKKHGADHAIKYNKDTYQEQVNSIGEVSVVFDTVGIPQSITESVHLLPRGGKMVLAGYGAGKDFIAPLSILALNEIEVYGSRGVTNLELEKLLKLVSTGKIKPIIGETYPLTEINTVLRKLREGKIKARAVVIP